MLKLFKSIVGFHNFDKNLYTYRQYRSFEEYLSSFDSSVTREKYFTRYILCITLGRF